MTEDGGEQEDERDQLSDATIADNNGNSIMQRLTPEFGENREMIQLSHVTYRNTIPRSDYEDIIRLFARKGLANDIPIKRS